MCSDFRSEVFNLDDYEHLARKVLTPAAYAYYSGGAGDETTLRDNTDAFRRRKLRPRVMRDVSSVDTAGAFLGESVSFPVGLAPCAQQVLAHPEGEIPTARAARDAGILMCVSTLGSRSLEEIAAVGDAPRWFQLYMHRDRGISKELIEKACAAGFSAIVVTADLPYPGYRERELRDPLVYENELPFANFAGRISESTELMTLLDGIIANSVTWNDLEWVRSISDVPVLVKGIVTGEDATLALGNGAAGVVVSNHGGRQLDHAPASIDVLEEVVESLDGRAEVFLDGGIRRGVDVAIALALGAQGVFIGRPYLYALAVAGEEGVAHALGLLRTELTNAMGLLGVTSVGELGPSHVA